ncbi:hypothetical protein CSA37_05055 [Candidatus Fermentibacteria bacterium]|nr:MAG: hypothetical protein CSA37_10345 [Candidatus Fermentibacteria bacterium]PIE52297.1 MAG: hypothetical protein CSA37_07450 [Candidatus Fermentibacteria bacterium]PIE52792.1 MAG: hypothetical protein CSA37_05055 [Candidatus Fermentibacteria bacterium]
MRILFLVHRSMPYHGGSERYVWEHAVAAVREGHSVTVATTDAWDMSWLVSRKGRRLPAGRSVISGVELIRFPVAHPPAQNLLRAVFRRIRPGGKDRFYYPNPFIPALDRWIRSSGSRFDIVHANAMPFLLYAGYRLASSAGIPLVSVPHANIGSADHRILPMKYFSGMQPEILRQSALVVAQNRFEASVYVDECGVDPRRIMPGGSGIDPEEWEDADGQAARKALSLSPFSKIVLSMTAHCRDKGSFSLLDASVKLWQEGADFTLVLAGPVMDDFREKLNSVSSVIPDGRLVVTGYLPERLRKDLFKAADIVAAPSRLDAFGIVLLDGWMGGSPVIGCRSGGMPDIIDHEKNGFLVNFGDWEDIAAKLKELLENHSLASSMAACGRKKTMENYTWEKVTSKLFHRLEEDGLWKG